MTANDLQCNRCNCKCGTTYNNRNIMRYIFLLIHQIHKRQTKAKVVFAPRTVPLNQLYFSASIQFSKCLLCTFSVKFDKYLKRSLKLSAT